MSHKSPKDCKSITEWIKQYIITIEPIPPKEQLLSPSYEITSNTYDTLKYVINNNNNVLVNLLSEDTLVGTIGAKDKLAIEYTWSQDQYTLNKGYKFSADDYEDSDITYFMVTRPEKPSYAISITQPTNGTISCDKSVASYGEQVVATITPNEGYELSKFYVNDVESDTTFSMPDNDVTLSASLEWIIYGTLNAPTYEILSNTTTELIYSIKNSNNVDVLFNGETVSAEGALELTHVWGSGETSLLINGYFSQEHYINSSELVATIDKPSEPTPAVMPEKGDLITMDLGDTTSKYGTLHQYRVLKVDGNNAEVVAMYEPTTSQTFGSSQAYSGSSLDTYLNTTWYNTLSEKAKAAIVDNEITQYKYSSGSVSDTHRSYATYSSKAVYASGLTRHIYALDVEDIEMYFGGTGGSASAKTQGTFTTSDLMTLFYKSTSTISGKYLWLRSADADYSDYCWYVTGSSGYVYNNSYYIGNAVRPAFIIDLSKIEWSKSE